TVILFKNLTSAGLSCVLLDEVCVVGVVAVVLDENPNGLRLLQLPNKMIEAINGIDFLFIQSILKTNNIFEWPGARKFKSIFLKCGYLFKRNLLRKIAIHFYLQPGSKIL